MKNELKKRLEELARLKEKAFDEAYKAEFDAFTAAAKLIVKMTNGQIGEKTAREMVWTKRNEILNIVAYADQRRRECKPPDCHLSIKFKEDMKHE